MVLVALDHVRDALDPLIAIRRVAAELVVVRVRLDVRLVDDVQPVTVAEVEPVRIVRIVGRAHCVDVELLHQQYVLLHRCACDHAAVRIVVLVPVDPGDQHGLAVHEQLAIVNLDAPEAHRGRDRLPVRADLERVQRRILCRPQLRGAYLTFEPPVLECALCHDTSMPVEDARVAVLCEHREPSVGARADFDVAHGRRDELDGTRETGVPPLVLILDEARVRPADDDCDELVRTVVVDEPADVELGRRAGILRDSDRLTVHQQVQHALRAAEVEDDRARAPAPRDRERPPVDARLVLLGNVRRQLRKRHHDVRVVRPSEALHRPEPRHLDLVPAARAVRARAARPPAVPSSRNSQLPSKLRTREALRASVAVGASRLWLASSGSSHVRRPPT